MIHYDQHLGLSDLPDIVSRAVRDLAPHRNEFDSIVTSGVSGLMVAAPVAVMLDKPLVIVREEDGGPKCWHAQTVEGAADAGRRTLFLDDEVQRGRTLSYVKEELARYTRAEVVARYEYHDAKYVTGERAEQTWTADRLPSQRDRWSMNGRDKWSSPIAAWQEQRSL
jgi:adenine/guanine phosphoribosyltransferase-like PRPP-binding protein